MKKIQVLGPFNSGTNLIMKMIEDNCLSVEDGQMTKQSENFFFWKHTLRKDFIDKAMLDNFHRDGLLIMMYKHPFNWASSVFQTPYDIVFDDGMLGGVTMQGRKYSSIFELYDRYYTMYQQLIQEYPGKIVLLDYQKMIDQETCEAYIHERLRQLGLVLVDRTKIQDVLSYPSKTLGVQVKNAHEAVIKYSRVQENIRHILDVVAGPQMKKTIEKILQDHVSYFTSL